MVTPNSRAFSEAVGVFLWEKQGSRTPPKAALRAALARFDNRPPGRRKRPYRGWGKRPRKPPRKPPRRRGGEAPFTHKNTDNAFTE